MIPEAPTKERCSKFSDYLLETYVDENSKYPPAFALQNLAVQLNALRMFKNVYESSTKILQIGSFGKFQPRKLL
jgi:hypothetical protein